MKYLIGNWKMSLSIAESILLAKQYKQAFSSSSDLFVGFAPSASALYPASQALEADSKDVKSIKLGAQNLHWEPRGAFTGEISALQLLECSGSFSLAGHSDVRHQFGESDSLIAKRVAGILNNNLLPVFCFGETFSEKQSGIGFDSIKRQLTALTEVISKDQASKILLAYEPVWAISGGNAAHQAATAQDVAAAHDFVATTYKQLFGVDSLGILYGGSANPSNCKELSMVPKVDGFLVGGASLKVDTFMPLYNALLS